MPDKIRIFNIDRATVEPLLVYSVVSPPCQPQVTGVISREFISLSKAHGRLDLGASLHVTRRPTNVECAPVSVPQVTYAADRVLLIVCAKNIATASRKHIAHQLRDQHLAMELAASYPSHNELFHSEL